LLAWLGTNVEAVASVEEVMLSFDEEFDIENAVGVQLDKIGGIVGRQRLLDFQPSDGSSAMLEDDMYRIVLKAKVAINHWDGTIPGMYELWWNLLPDYKVFIQDNQNMTMTVFLEGYTPDLLIELIEHDYIIPRPQGVGLRIVIRVTEEFTDIYYTAVATNEVIREWFIEEGDPITDSTEYHAVAVSEIIREEYADNE